VLLEVPGSAGGLAFDDGTGAVMTLVGKNVAFSRFTIPTCFGGIYSVAALEATTTPSCGWGPRTGSRCAPDVRVRHHHVGIVVHQERGSGGADALTYDNDNPLPPVMDGLGRGARSSTAAAPVRVGLPAAAEGQNVYALVNGQVRGPYVVGSAAR
jgi:hypothetical protein